MIGAQMLGGNPQRPGGRAEHDFYATPSEVTQALLNAEPVWPLSIWEPFAGNGAMSAVIEAAGYTVTSTDLNDHGTHPTFKGTVIGGVPYDWVDLLGDAIISNPPFNALPEIIERFARVRPKKMALLHPLNFWSAVSRSRLWTAWQPVRIHQLTWRVDFMGAGRPTMNLAWSVWEDRMVEYTELLRLDRPPETAKAAKAAPKSKRCYSFGAW